MISQSAILRKNKNMEKIEHRDGKKYWTIMIDTEDAFKRVSLDSNYREHSMTNERGERYVLLNDDQALFNRLLKNAVSELWLRMARMAKNIAGGIKYSEDFIALSLEVSDNHDDNILFVLSNNIDLFTDAWVLRQWYESNHLYDDMLRCEQNATTAMSQIVTCVHYRKKAVKLPIHPLL